MNKNLRIYLYTFFGVGLGIFLIGFAGINISLKYIQNKYIQLQIDVNKRQAEQMSIFIQSQIKNGVPKDTIRNQFQGAIMGTEMDKGFLCMYDTREDHLVCHPDKNAIGARFDKNFIFKNPYEESEKLITDIYKQGKPAGGIFVQGTQRTDIIYTVPVKGTDWFVNAHENINAISTEIRLLRNRYIWGSLILGFLIAISATVTARRISRRYEKEIELKNEELDRNNNEISLQNKQITDSINYARKIQTAVLPSLAILNRNCPENFILYKPKDIVSGDFYWFSQVDEFMVIVAADCTGHGVPGAFMSMLGVTMLNEIINKRKILQSHFILNELREQIKLALGQSGTSGEQQDGMDISLCIINLENLQMQYSGAFNSAYLLRKENSISAYKLSEIQADHMPIGVHPKDKISFTQNKADLRKSDRIYLFSDGFSSQFGGAKNEKFKSKRFQELILSKQAIDMKSQKAELNKALIEWQGELEQVDDILVIGLEI